MGKKILKNYGGDLSVPPGFEPLTTFRLKRVENNGEADDKESKSRSVDGPLTDADIEKCKASFRQKFRLGGDRIEGLRNDCDREQTEVEMADVQVSSREYPVRNGLSNGVLRGCTNNDDSMKHISWSQTEESCLPVLDDAPTFYPTDEEFMDSLKYIARIRPKAERYGVCRIVPPSSWQPPYILNRGKTYQSVEFSTKVQRVNRLKQMYMKRKPSRLDEKKETKRLKVSSTIEVESNDECVEETAENQSNQSTALVSEFDSGRQFTLQSFKRYADDFKKQYFCKNDKAKDPNECLSTEVEVWDEPLIARIECEYWRIVENASEKIEVLSGPESRSRTWTSGFPFIDSPTYMTEHFKYLKSEWNFNNIPKLSGSLLPYGCNDTSAILVPRLFIGMCFTSQSWRIEDHYLYSLNHMHFGDSKVWYGIPGQYRFKFMEVVKKLFPSLPKNHELIHELVTQLSPSVLKSEGIPVYRCVQNPWEFVLFFPGAYHSGLSCGYNCSESVSFAPFDWLPHGHDAVELYSHHYHKTSISHDKLLLRAAVEAVIAQSESFTLKYSSTKNQTWISVCGKNGILTEAVKLRIRLEGIRREHLCNFPTSRMMDEFDDTTKRECAICQFDLFLSFVGCPCSPNRYTCLRHAKQLCSCAWSEKCMYFRYDITELNLLVEALEGNMEAISSWFKKKRLRSMLDSVVSADALPNGNKIELTSTIENGSIKGPSVKEENQNQIVGTSHPTPNSVVLLSSDEDE